MIAPACADFQLEFIYQCCAFSDLICHLLIIMPHKEKLVSLWG